MQQNTAHKATCLSLWVGGNWGSRLDITNTLWICLSSSQAFTGKGQDEYFWGKTGLL